MTVVVTGSAGFIGQHLARALDEAAIDWVGFELGDDLDAVLAGRWEAIFHLGAISDTTCEDAIALQVNNVGLTKKLAGFCRARMLPFIFASSASVYGNNGEGPLNAYARSKKVAEEFVYPGSGILMFDAWCLRLFNVYGPGEAPKGSQASMIHQLLAGRRSIFEPFAQRDFVHVDDVVRVMLWVLKHRPQSGIYDVGTGEARTFNDLAHICRGDDFFYEPMPDSLSGKYQFYTQADLTRLRAAGYDRPFLSLEEGVARMRK